MLIKKLIKVCIIAIAIIVIAGVVPGIYISNFYTALIVAIVWGFIMLIVRPILKLLTIPISVISFGMFAFILNALLFWVITVFVPGFTINGFIPALEGSIILAILSGSLNLIL